MYFHSVYVDRTSNESMTEQNNPMCGLASDRTEINWD